MTETGPEGTTGATRAARSEGAEGRTPALEVTAAGGTTLAAAVSTVSVLVSVGTHRHHSIQSLI